MPRRSVVVPSLESAPGLHAPRDSCDAVPVRDRNRCRACQRNCRASVSICAPVVPSEIARAQSRYAAQHAGKSIAHFAGGSPIAMVRVTSVYRHSIARRIDQQQIAWRNPPVCLAGNAVVHDGAVRPGAGDGRERDVLQRSGVRGGTSPAPRRCRSPSARPVGASRSIQEESRERHRIVADAPCVRLRSRSRIDGLEQTHRVAAAHRLAPAVTIRRLSASARSRWSSAIDAPRCASSVSLGVSASGSSTSAVCSRWSRALFDSLR